MIWRQKKQWTHSFPPPQALHPTHINTKLLLPLPIPVKSTWYCHFTEATSQRPMSSHPSPMYFWTSHVVSRWTTWVTPFWSYAASPSSGFTNNCSSPLKSFQSTFIHSTFALSPYAMLRKQQVTKTDTCFLLYYLTYLLINSPSTKLTFKVFPITHSKLICPTTLAHTTPQPQPEYEQHFPVSRASTWNPPLSFLPAEVPFSTKACLKGPYRLCNCILIHLRARKTRLFCPCHNSVIITHCLLLFTLIAVTFKRLETPGRQKSSISHNCPSSSMHTGFGQLTFAKWRNKSQHRHCLPSEVSSTTVSLS